MFKELEVLKLQLEILMERYDDTETEWTKVHDDVLHYLEIARRAIKISQNKIIDTYVKEEK